MANISGQKLQQELAVIDYILEQGARGHHLLFSEELLRRHLRMAPELLRQRRDAHLAEINAALDRSLAMRGIQAKKEFIASLEPEVQEGLVFTYFEALERKIKRDHPLLN